jgi:hypothetical protein
VLRYIVTFLPLVLTLVSLATTILAAADPCLPGDCAGP